MKPWIFYRQPYGTGLRICQVELCFSSCVCVYSQEKMCPVHLYHRVYIVDRNFLVQKYIFSCLPGTFRHSLGLQSKQKFIVDNRTIWLVNMKRQNKQMHGWISPRRACDPCGTGKMSSMYHMLLIYDVKWTTKIDGPFNIILYFSYVKCLDIVMFVVK